MRVAFAVVATLILLGLVAAGLARAGEDPGQGIGMALVFLFLIGLVWYVPFGGGRRKGMQRKLRALAEELGASVSQAPHETILELEVEGQPATLVWGFVKWGKRRIMHDSLRFELALPAPLPRFRIYNPRTFKIVLKTFPDEQRIALSKELEREIKAASPEPDRVAEQLPHEVFELAAHLFHRPAHVTPHIWGDPTGWEMWCEGTRVEGVLPNRWDMERVRGTLRLLSLLVESSQTGRKNV